MSKPEQLQAGVARPLIPAALQREPPRGSSHAL